VNINRGQQLREEDQNQLVKNLSLVRELGGELLTTAETDVPGALRRIAIQKNVTQIIVGRPTRRWFKDIIEGGSLLDQLVQVSGDFDVHVIRQDSTRSATQASWLRTVNLNSHFGDYWNVVWSLVVVSIISAIASPFVGYKAVGFIFLLAVLGVSLFFSMGPILLAAVSSALIWDYFFIPPQLTFLITDKEDIIMCAMYFIAAFTTGMLTNKIRFHERLLKEREERTTLLYEIVSDIVSSSNRTEFIQSICSRVGKLLDGECGVYLKNQQGSLEIVSTQNDPFASSEKALAVATWSFQSNKRAGWSTDTLSEALALYTPLTGRGTPVGVIAFKPFSRRKLRIEHEILITTVAKQLAISIERESFEDAARESESLKQSETLHQTLLNSVSHELRTPLTSIIGSATAMAMLSKGKNADFELLAKEVVEGSERLNRVVENLLDMTRLNSGVLSLQLEWHDIQDLIGVTLQKLGRYKNNHTISADVNEKLTLVEIDFRLFEHVLSNLILNSVLYSPKKTSIAINAWADDKYFHLSVSDQGPGLSDDLLEKVFEKFYRVPGTPAGGTGLGLAISKSIVELHGGKIWAENLSPNGLKISIRLPIGNPPMVHL
jgi:two-component system sensor histidine kinase KdpD